MEKENKMAGRQITFVRCPRCGKWSRASEAFHPQDDQPFDVYICEKCGVEFADFETTFKSI